MASPSPRPPPSKLYDLDVTIISAKHLKNVNWKTGDLKPYVILWVDPDRRQSTKPDDFGSTRPVWNERFLLPLTPLSPRDSILSLDIFHSKPSETPKPLVASLRFEIRHLLSDPDDRIRTLPLLRPSGRPHGKIRLKLSLIERPNPIPIENYHSAPPPPTHPHPHPHPPSYYYSSAPPPNYRGYTSSSSSSYSSFPPPPPPATSPPPPSPPQPYSYSAYSDPHSGYYSAYYAPPPVAPPRPFFERYGGTGPSAPADYTPYDYQKRSVGKGMGVVGVGAVAGALGGLALEEGVKYEEEKVAENELGSTATREDRYGEYHRTEY